MNSIPEAGIYLIRQGRTFLTQNGGSCHNCAANKNPELCNALPNCSSETANVYFEEVPLPKEKSMPEIKEPKIVITPSILIKRRIKRLERELKALKKDTSSYTTPEESTLAGAISAHYEILDFI